MIIGVTGRIATGKTSLAKAFAQRGYAVFDADETYKHLLDTSVCMQKELLNEFKTLDRLVILSEVIDDNKSLERLNGITHKYVTERIYQFISENSGKNIVLDVPVPVEKGFIDITDIIIVTVASEDVQISRLMQRYSIDKEQALRRIKMQKSQADYLSIGDIILNTDKTDQGDLMTFIDMFENGENTYIKSVKD